MEIYTGICRSTLQLLSFAIGGAGVQCRPVLIVTEQRPLVVHLQPVKRELLFVRELQASTLIYFASKDKSH